MVTVDRELGHITNVKFECDRCGRRCDQGNTRTGKLWAYEDEELCVECLLEALEADGVIREAE